MKVLVCGGSAYKDKAALYRRLDELHMQHRITLIINGGARGADSIARNWAEDRGITIKTYRVRSGPDRRLGFIELNVEMLEKEQPELVVACPGGEVTADMQARAQALSIRIESVLDDREN